jgi:hypothetical protein
MVSLGIPYQGAVSLDGIAGLIDDWFIGSFLSRSKAPGEN